MSKKQPKIPGLKKKLAAVATEHVQRGNVYYVAVRHDDWCPTLRTQRVEDCVCESYVEKPELIA